MTWYGAWLARSPTRRFDASIEPDRAPRANGDPLAHLAKRAIDGDEPATRALLEALSPDLLRIARMILGPSHAEIEDVLQNSLVGVLKQLPFFRWESSVMHYAKRIAAKRALDTRRRNATRRRMLGEIEAQQASTQSSPPKPIEDRRRDELRRLLDELPEEQAQALVMRVVLGHSIEEIAEATEAPINTVRSRMRLAKEALRNKLSETTQSLELGEVDS